jgi:DNA-binding NarL/FixJ family response regulator
LQNVLLIQNDAADGTAVRDALINSRDGSFRVVWVRDCAAGLKALARKMAKENSDADRIAAILVDLSLPDGSGIETFSRLIQAAPQIPMLILTTVQDENIAKLAVEGGAHEYLLKDRLDAYLLPKAVSRMIERAANTEILFEEKERAQVTLDSIGDAVVSTDVSGHVTYLNAVAETLTGWLQQEAAGHPLEEVLRLIDGNAQSHGTRNPGKQDRESYTELHFDPP